MIIFVFLGSTLFTRNSRIIIINGSFVFSFTSQIAVSTLRLNFVSQPKTGEGTSLCLFYVMLANSIEDWLKAIPEGETIFLNRNNLLSRTKAL